MWCPLCHSDVAAEFTADDRRLLCARCGEVLAISPVPRRPLPLNAGTALDAAALLARWSAEETLLEHRTESKIPTAQLHEFEDQQGPERTVSKQSDCDLAEDANSAVSNLYSLETESDNGLPPFPPTPPDSSTVDRSFRIAPLADLPTNKEEQKVSSSRRSREQRAPVEPTNWVFVAGQLAAYGGVFVLTCGTAMVVTSLAKGAGQETQSGWLLATIGQMLLFLGVVTIISSGLEQTRSEFRRELRRLRKIIVQLREAQPTSPRRNRPAA